MAADPSSMVREEFSASTDMHQCIFRLFSAKYVLLDTSGKYTSWYIHVNRACEYVTK
jgi:hypothetical protein